MCVHSRFVQFFDKKIIRWGDDQLIVYSGWNNGIKFLDFRPKNSRDGSFCVFNLSNDDCIVQLSQKPLSNTKRYLSNDVW